MLAGTSLQARVQATQPLQAAAHKRRGRTPKLTAVASYAGVFLLVMSIVAAGYRPTQTVGEVANAANPAGGQLSVLNAPDTSLISERPSVDQVAASAVAANLAKAAQLPVANNVTSLSVSLETENDLAQVDNAVISKPQIVQVNGGRREVTIYTAKAGDTVPLVASAHHITPDTLKWANNLTSDALEPGRKLTILPVDGILYTAKAGDTIASVADKYKADKDRIVLFNDLEGKEIVKDQKVVIPSGSLPEEERPGYVAPRRAAFGTSANGVAATSGYSQSYGAGFGGSTWFIRRGTPMYAGNKYAFGNCTAYAYDRRAELGRPIGGMWGHAATWAINARAAGFVVNKTPAVGAIIQNGGGYGHVAIVEEVLPDGSVRISEMNAYVPGGGFNTVSGRTIPAGNVAAYSYIH